MINSRQRKLTNYSNSLRDSFRKKTTLSNLSNISNISSNSFINTEKDIIRIFKSSKMIYRAKPIFENIDDNNDYIQKSRKKIKYYLRNLII